MSKFRNFLVLFICIFAISACSRNEFPELRAENEENIFAQAIGVDNANGANLAAEDINDGKVIIASVAKKDVDNKEVLVKAVKEVPQDEGVVIIASAAKENNDVVKVKPILKAKSAKKNNVQKIDFEKTDKKPLGKILADKQLNKIGSKEKITESVSVDVVFDEIVIAETAVAVNEVSVEENFEPSITYQVDTFYFDNGSSLVKNEYKSRIKDIVKEAKNNNAYIYILGFSSSRTKDTDYVSHKMINFQTSLERSESVAEEFVKAGMPKNKVVMEALSDSRPLYLEVMPEGERLNRRVEVYIGY